MAGWDSLLSETSIVAWQSIADDRAEKPVKITGARLCCICLAYVFQGSIMLSPLYKLNLSAQSKVTLQLTVSLSDLVERFLASALAGGPEKNFSPGPEPAFGGSVAVMQNFLSQSARVVECNIVQFIQGK